jgi:Flp pilus assembly protein TadG
MTSSRHPSPSPNCARIGWARPAPARAPRRGWPRVTKVEATMRARRDDDGFFTIWVLGLCACLFVVGGISLDVWRGFSERRALANLTDGAATAAASQIDLDAYRAKPSVVRLDREEAQRRAAAYIETESARNHVAVRDVEVSVSDTRVVVRASTDLDLTLTRILTPGSKPIGVTTTSAADPKEA